MSPTAADDRTEVGSYFIANYPPFSVWTQEAVDTRRPAGAGVAADRRAARAVPAHPVLPEALSLLLFPRLHRQEREGSAGLSRYARARVGAVRRAAGDRRPAAELRLLRRRHAVVSLDAAVAEPGRRAWMRSARGATPKRSRSSASPARSPRPSWPRFARSASRASVSASRTSTIAFSRSTAARIARPRSAAPTRLRGRSSFPQINIDLIAGMLGETDDNWRTCVQRTIELAPDSVTIYQMELPFNTTISKYAPVGREPSRRRRRATGRPSGAGWTRRSRRSKRAGYTVASAYAVVKNPATKFVYRDRLWQGADMVGLGVASFGHISGVHMQNLDHVRAVLREHRARRAAARRAGCSPTRRRAADPRVRPAAEARRGAAAYFEHKYGVDVLERFRAPLDRAGRRAAAHGDARPLTLSREGLLRVDSLLPRFFLPAASKLRYT